MGMRTFNARTTGDDLEPEGLLTRGKHDAVGDGGCAMTSTIAQRMLRNKLWIALFFALFCGVMSWANFSFLCAGYGDASFAVSILLLSATVLTGSFLRMLSPLRDVYSGAGAGRDAVDSAVWTLLYFCMFSLLSYALHWRMHISSLALAATLCVLAIFSFQRMARLWITYRTSFAAPLRVLLIGEGEGMVAARRALCARDWRISEASLIAPEGVSADADFDFNLDELRPLAANFDAVILAASFADQLRYESYLQRCEELALPVYSLRKTPSWLGGRSLRYAGVTLHALPVTPAEDLSYLIVKRAFDFCFSLACILFISPLLAALAVVVKFSSPGPIFYRQKRVGKYGRVFELLKFRTMRVSVNDEPGWTVANDPRRTWLGGFLRKSCFDELPQLFNILRGEMSLIGPRPEQPVFVEQFSREIKHYNARHLVSAGLSGWAQVNGWRGDTDIQERINCDLHYIRNWSFFFDLKIIVRTFVYGFFSKNAY